MKDYTNHWLIGRISRYLQIDSYDALKIAFSAAAFFCIIGSYSILRSLKTSIFLGFVGREYEPIAKMLAIVIAIPVMFLYARIIDAFKRHQIVYCFLGTYIILGLFFAYCFAHPVYGIANTQTSPTRFIGWMFEIAMDLFQALIVGTFWSFLNSISTPSFAGKGYGPIVACSRLGGILTPVISLLMLEKSNLAPSFTIPFLTILASLLLIGAIFCIHHLKYSVPEQYLQGYESATNHDDPKGTPGIFEGLRLMLTEPYVLGIFGLVFSFEVINIIFDYQMHVLMSIETNNQVGAMSSFMLLYTGTFQALSLLFALFGTSKLLGKFGVQRCLLIMPIIVIALALLPVFYPKLITIFFVMVMLRAFNYGFNHPLREILFIPTIKDIQFKSKAWIESFGRTLSKSTGSSLNYVAIKFSPYLCLILESAFSITLAVVWLVMAIAIGKRYVQTIASSSVIGKREK